MTETFLIAAFEYSFALELAITDILKQGIDRERIKTIPLEKQSAHMGICTGTYVKEEGFSKFDLSLIFANILSIILGSLGFIWEWGPIVWGIIGFSGGILIGILVKSIMNSRRRIKKDRKDQTEVFLMIKCPQEMKNTVSEILWSHNVIGISEI